MGLVDYWHIARRRWLIIVVVAAVCAVAAAGYVRSSPKVYTASSSMYVSMATGTSVNDSYQGGLAAQQRVRSYMDLASSAEVAKRVIADRGLTMSVAELRGRIKAVSPPATTIVIITVTDATAEGARTLADAVVSQFRALIAELETIERNAAPAARVAVVDKAELPGAPTSPQTSRILALGLLAGLVLGALAAFARDRTDRALRTSNDLEAILPVPILGIIDAGRPGAVDETRRLRTRLLQEGDASTVLVTSLSRESEPEVTTALAKALADTGRHVVLIDADTSRRGVSRGVSTDRTAGLASVLSGAAPVADALIGWPQTGVTLLPMGEVDPQTSDLLASDRFAAIVAKLRTDYDHVLMQTAPVAHSADAIAVAPLCEHSVGVVALGATTAPQLRGALATFGDNPLTGAVAYSQPGNRLLRLVGRRK
ncbi:GNVR domain-containing protein [Nocardia sp. NPDC052566]|uniref:GNVR domain-containing protein n=1 Tax=Nocardia sp. NPDC052566 TaxID=3364330 RepID=UPI0037CB136F